MLTLFLEARRIPNDTIVKKINGKVKFTLSREIKIFGEGKQVIKTDGIVFLVNEANINGYPDTTHFAVEFEGEEELMSFIHEELLPFTP